MKSQSKFISAIDRGAELVVAAIFAVIFFIAIWQVFNRFVINASLSWSEEAQIFGHIWIVFLGIPIAYKRQAHLHIETFCDMFPRKFRAAFNLFVELLWAAFALLLVSMGWMVAEIAHMQESPGLGIPMSYPYYGLVVGGLYLLFVAVCRILGCAWRVPS